MTRTGRDSTASDTLSLATSAGHSEPGVAGKPELVDQLKALLGGTTEGLVLVDSRGEVVRANRAFHDISGYPQQETAGKRLEDLEVFDQTTATEMARRFSAVLCGQQPGPLETPATGKTGQPLNLQLLFSAWRRAGRIAGVVVSVKEVSSIKKMKSLQRDEERFRNLVETTSDWVWETDGKGVYTYVSPRVADVLGYQPHEVVGKSHLDFMPLEDARQSNGKVTAIMASGEPFRFILMKKLHKNGHPVFLETSGTPFFGDDGDIRGYRGIHRDVTERRKAMDEVQRTYHKLESTVESVIQAMALTVEKRDHYTAGHQQRVKQLGCAIAKEMQLSDERVQVVRVAGLLHDLGKIFVPVEILTKPGHLSETEFAIIRTHPQSAYDVLGGIEFPWPIAQVVFQHHERMNGSGYPEGLQGAEITSEARILAVADAVEAMTFHRAYCPALGLDAALKEIVRQKEALYDAKVVEACLNVFLDRGFAWA
ncbi:MAG: PAS domain S-box protein [Chloroflexi bacterium]|nr:PAS domain S-box protein [Chloroflexota bacterium]